ncbi:hypothetical protein AVEN_172276-1 [Araneus ventricosus]|uniref:Uncharacterized protein n=1 Tax=Araneus ventricosus TaxID=182803 RepID=A0A4Y2QFH3_ARAVE|nr:hypothetical protein AVEN_172276-1 [Araneus ventricosus]
MRRQTLGCQSAHPGTDTLGTLGQFEVRNIRIRPASTAPTMHHSRRHRLMKVLVLTSLTLPQAYIPESDIKLTSVLPQRFPVRHSVRRIDFPSCGTYLNRKSRSLEPHKPLDPNLSKDARSTRSVVPRLIH